MTSVEYEKTMDTLVARILTLIEHSGITASDAEGIPAYLRVAIEQNNKNILRTSAFKVTPEPED